MKSRPRSNKKRTQEIKEILLSLYDSPRSELNHKNIFELLIAVILSAQCTDKRVNIVTPALFDAYPTPKDLADANLDHIKELIKSINFYNNKALFIKEASFRIHTEFSDQVPRDLASLLSLSGVGKKSASVVLGEMGQNTIAVDTHVYRVAHRLGISKAKSVDETQNDLQKAFKNNLPRLHHSMVLFGRHRCKAIAPLCEGCALENYCVSKERFKANG